VNVEATLSSKGAALCYEKRVGGLDLALVEVGGPEGSCALIVLRLGRPRLGPG